MAGHMGDDARHHAEPAGRAHRCRPRPDPGPRRGAGRQGRLDPGARRGEGGAAGRRAEAGRDPRATAQTRGAEPPQRSGQKLMELKVTTLAGEDAGNGRRSPTRSSGSSRAPTSCSAWCAGSSPKRQQGTHKAKTRAEIARTGEEDVQAEGHRPRPPRQQGGAAVPRRRQGASARSCAAMRIDLPKKVRALGAEARAVGQGQGAKPHRRRRADAAGGQDQGARRAVRQARPRQRADHRRRRDRRRISAAPPRNIPNIDVLPIQGINVYDILRRDTLVLTKAAVEALEERFK